MINVDRVRRAAIVIVVGLVVGIGLGLRSADPSGADPPAAAARARAVGDAARNADAALARLSANLAGALDHGRHGTALTVSGDSRPEPELTAAADRLAGSSDDADAARRALRALAGVAAAVDPRVGVPSLSYGAPDLQLIAAQLRASAAAATTFVERRRAAQAVVDDLAAALAALEHDLPGLAVVSLDEADAPLALLSAWEERPPLFRYWMTVSADLIGAARDIANATLAHDEAALVAAGRRYAKAAEAARGADNALAVTLSEEGSGVSAVPLRRLAAAADEASDARAALVPLLQGVH
jgi:hypothetical protein